MPERPILILPKPSLKDKQPGRGGGGEAPHPTDKAGQAQRIGQQFAQVQAAFVSDEPGDIERVLVMETSDRIEGLQNAVNRINGLEWLAEMDVDDIELHNLYDEETGQKIKGGRFYILSSNKQATDRLLGLWERHKSGKNLAYGLGRFERLFAHLITLRRWSVRDKFRDTGILGIWKEEYQIKRETNSPIDFEIELHYSTNREKQNRNAEEIRQKVHDIDGTVGQTICMNDIAFHAMKVSMPAGSISQVVKHNWDSPELPDALPSVFGSEAVKYCRPIGQHIEAARELPNFVLDKTFASPTNNPPALALLDGVPLLRHAALDRRLIFYDPDNYTSSYEPSQQKHGTAMASLICHGDLNRSSDEHTPLNRPLYVRPIMKPDSSFMDEEKIPAEVFQEDIVERAVRDMYEGESPEIRGIRVINLSLGNCDQHYLYEMSPWARLLDWLSFKYQVLFIVSAGNYGDHIELADTGGTQVEKQVVAGIDKNQRNHRLLSPAESINALTVGSLHYDLSGELDGAIRGFNPVKNGNSPAPYSRIGPGYRGAIKPEIFASGGRLLYDRKPDNNQALVPVLGNNPPGIRVACPGTAPERLANTSYQAGTSNAAAIASHNAGHIYEMLEELREEQGNEPSPDFDAVLIKALLVHSASQGESTNAYNHLKSSVNSRKFKKYLSRYLGYGNINVGRILECTRARATAIGCGRIDQKHRHLFNFPLPTGITIHDYLKLTVTLAWFSPINPLHIGIRRAKLRFTGESLKGEDGHKRQESDWQQVLKGTVQHEIFDLKKSNLQENQLTIFVECAADAGELDTEIPYGLAVTLEIAEQEELDLYQMVQSRIRQPVVAK